MRSKYDLINIDGNNTIEVIYQHIQSKIDKFLVLDKKEVLKKIEIK